MNNYNESDLYDTLNSLAITYRTKGKEIQLDYCPYCEKDKKNKSDHFAFNRENGTFNCVKCGSKGNLITFRRENGLQPFSNLTYRTIDQKYAGSLVNQDENYYKAYSSSRGIPENILKKYGVGKTNYPGLGVCRTYQFVDTDGKVVNIKYVNAKKEMRQEKDTKHIYYGLQFLDYSKPVLHITEGEDDCHALVAMGFENVVSVPNGAQSYNENMGQINKLFKKIILFFDNDKPGQEGAEQFARKAGVWKCFNVLLPFKDVRECFIHGLEFFVFQKLITTAKQFEYNGNEKSRPALTIHERFNRYERECKVNEMGNIFNLSPIDTITGGLRKGDVVTICADPGCYKTTLLMNLLLRTAANIYEGFVLFFSFEMQIEAEFERELQIITQAKTYELRQWAKEKNERWIEYKNNLQESYCRKILVSEESNATIPEMIQIIKRTEDMYGEKCVVVGIDYIDFVKANSNREYEAIKENMNGIKTQIARGCGTSVIVLVQTNREKGGEGVEVGLRSGKGGTGIEAASDFMIGLWRDDDEILGRITKHRRIDSIYKGKPYPYLKFNMTKENYFIESIEIIPKPKKKKNEDNDF